MLVLKKNPKKNVFLYVVCEKYLGSQRHARILKHCYA